MKRCVIDQSTVNDFECYLKECEKGAATIEKYIRDVRAFAKFMNKKEVTKTSVIGYKKYLAEEGYSARSINSMLASLNSLFGFLKISECRVKSVRIQQRMYCYENKELSKEEYLRLVSTANERKNERLALILQTICSTGIRVSELKFITMETVRKGEAVVSLKGKTRVIFIVKELRDKLLFYARRRGISSGCIFVTRSGNVIGRVYIWREMKKLCRMAEVDEQKVFPHNLRHLFAKIFYSIDKDLAKLSDILGHSSIETTRIYIMSSGIEHRRCMENMRLII